MNQLSLIGLVFASIVVSACNSATPPTAPDAMLVMPDPSSPPAAGGVSASWAGVGHGVSGSVRFTVQNGVARLDFSDDFTVSAVPGPFVYINTTNNANTGQPLRVSALQKNAGAQSYSFQLPAGVSYKWVLIWCDPFNVGVAEAQVPPNSPGTP